MKLSVFAFFLLFFCAIYSQPADTLYRNGKVLIRSNILVTMDSGELKAKQSIQSLSATSVRQNSVSQSRQANLCGVVSSFTPNRDTSFSTAFGQIFTSNSTNATAVQWLLNGITFGTQPTVNIGFGTAGLYEIKLIAKNGACTDTSTVYYVYTGVPTATPRTTMLNNYGFADRQEYSTCMDHVPNGGFILGGYSYYSSGMGTFGDFGLIMKIRETGCIEWSKFFQEYTGRVGGVKALRDSGCIVSVISSNFQKGTLLRYDKNGQLIWKYHYTYNGTGILFRQLYEAADGSIITAASDPNFDGFYVAKLSAAGMPVWCKHYLKSNDDFASPTGITEMGNRIFISGYLSNPNQEVQFDSEYNRDGFIISLNGANGNTLWSKAFGAIGFSDFFQQMYAYGNNLLVNDIRTNYLGAGNARQTYHFIDTLGVVLKSRAVGIAETLTSPFICNVLPLANKKLYLTRGAYQTLPLQPGFVYNSYWEKIDTGDHIYWRSKAGSISGYRFWYSAVGNNETIATLGEHSNLLMKVYDITNNFLFARIDTSGPAAPNCIFYQSANTIIPDQIVAVPLVWPTDITMSLVATNSIVVPNTVYTQMRYQCPDYVDSCSYIKINGVQRLCNLAQTYTYHASKNNGCGMPVSWQVSPGVQIITQTANDLTVRFPGFGQYTIAGYVNYSCNPVADSIQVTVTSGSASPNLGADTTLCIGNTIKLHAGTRFITYKWQDNSTDSTLMVAAPGLYWVTVTDSCGNILSDTVSVQFTTAVPINIGADRTKCNSDTLHLVAPPGFLNYNWSNNYNISSTTAPNVTINPLVDTAYYIKAEKTPGCFAYDTVRITVYRSPPINLGPDKSFCSGDSAIFNAGNGFQNYLWSTSAITQQITARSTGTYSVIATTINGCKSFDTVKVLSIYPLPVVRLDKDSAICRGSDKIVDAGNFSTYLWSTGSTAKTITVNSIGLYSVVVSDANGCKGSDTAKITIIRPLPAGFLPADTSVCSYGKIELKPFATYNQYLWNTGATTTAIVVSQPGIYVLRVTDGFTCAGSDSVTVAPKDCLKGFYIPTAFTPDGNGQNDLFRPMLFGSVKSYVFTVFNRWGQVVFTTTETGKGWNGKVAGAMQTTGGFAWACTYQFEGEPVKQEKGTVVVLY